MDPPQRVRNQRSPINPTHRLDPRVPETLPPAHPRLIIIQAAQITILLVTGVVQRLARRLNILPTRRHFVIRIFASSCARPSPEERSMRTPENAVGDEIEIKVITSLRTVCRLCGYSIKTISLLSSIFPLSARFFRVIRVLRKMLWNI